MIKKKRKPFFATAVGRTLKGAASIVAPGLVSALEGVSSVGDAVKIIRENTEIDDDVKFRLQELALDQYKAEVDDRIAARQREAAVAASGQADYLFKIVGAGVTIAFLGMVATAMGLIEFVPENQRVWDTVFGAVTAKFSAIISYYFGSSIGSKQKTDLLK